MPDPYNESGYLWNARLSVIERMTMGTGWLFSIADTRNMYGIARP